MTAIISKSNYTLLFKREFCPAIPQGFHLQDFDYIKAYMKNSSYTQKSVFIIQPNLQPNIILYTSQSDITTVTDKLLKSYISTSKKEIDSFIKKVLSRHCYKKHEDDYFINNNTPRNSKNIMRFFKNKYHADDHTFINITGQKQYFCESITIIPVKIFILNKSWKDIHTIIDQLNNNYIQNKF